MNLFSAMRQAAALQQKMAEVHARLAAQTVEFSSGGGAVSVTVRGDLEVVAVRIRPDVMHAADPALLEDMVRAAVNGGLRAAREMMEREFAAVAQQLGLPPGAVPNR
ncbi:MAG: YbaB/EbfC family nucleoid-associated protein [Kiritimatiellae bacterium]|nr:YbaB/EbfC family nucleoid-associated protein [Kiritimatiellia bacterium]